MEEIRVGVIGAGPDRSWASNAHVPALAFVPGIRLTAVGTSRPESAVRAARQFGAKHAFTDPRALAEHPEVDLVVVAVKVPAHEELVPAAVGAGKHVYCEWPLAPTTTTASELLAAASRAGVHHAVGLQARYSPAVVAARDLVRSGALGRLLSVTVHASREKGAEDAVPAWSEYTYDAAAGAGLLEVAGGHTLDAVEYVAGPIASVSAELSLRRPVRTVAETGASIAVTSPDHLALHGFLANGAVLSAHLHDGRLRGGGTLVELSGTAGDLRLESAGPDAARGVQISELTLRMAGESGDWGQVPLARNDLTGTPAFPVAGLYAALAADIREGKHSVPGFDTAVHVHRLLDEIRSSAATGRRVELGRSVREERVRCRS